MKKTALVGVGVGILVIVFVFSDVLAQPGPPGGSRSRSSMLSESILLKAQQLKDLTEHPGADMLSVKNVLEDLKRDIARYEETFVLESLTSKSPYPGEIKLGQTGKGNDSWIEASCLVPGELFIGAIRFRNTRGGSDYVRLYEIEITYHVPGGVKSEMFKVSDDKLYEYGRGYCEVRFTRPIRPVKIRVRIRHRTYGVEVWGMPVVLEKPGFFRPH